MAKTGHIEGVLEVKIGEAFLLAVDFRDRNDQSFVISSGTMSIFEEDGTSTSIVDEVVSTAVGLSGSIRVQVLIQSAVSATLSPGPHFAIWSLTLGDTQTRLVKQAIDMVDSP